MGVYGRDLGISDDVVKAIDDRACNRRKLVLRSSTDFKETLKGSKIVLMAVHEDAGHLRNPGSA
jgi:hypothetical protein